MLHFYLIAVYKLSTEVAVCFVQIEAMFSCQQALHKFDISTHFVDVAGSAGIVASSLYATRKGFIALEADNIIGLPAMQRDRSVLQLLDSFISIYSNGGISLFCDAIGLFD